MNKYQQAKEKARAAAVEWQLAASEKSLSYGELAAASAYFEQLARRYGLTREFRENAII